jgi:hypothetical protein
LEVPLKPRTNDALLAFSGFDLQGDVRGKIQNEDSDLVLSHKIEIAVWQFCFADSKHTGMKTNEPHTNNVLGLRVV